MTTTSLPPHEVGTVVSKDGTVIGYRKLGARGPRSSLFTAGGQSSQNLLSLAGALRDSFTLYVPDRRGRGMSGA